MSKKKIIVIGGGAAGFFSAINIALKSPNKYEIEILEKGLRPLQKLKVSGGGRCNFTNAELDLLEFSRNYPNGQKEVLQMLRKFSNYDMKEWLEKNDVKTKIETTNKMFPTSDLSQTIIDCFLSLCEKNKIKISFNCGVNDIEIIDNYFLINQTLKADFLIVTCGSSNLIWENLKKLNHKIIAPIPSLFTFISTEKKYSELMGLSIIDVELKLKNNKKNKICGDFLFTHQGFSGPSIINFSAFYARDLYNLNYNFDLIINFIKDKNAENIFEDLQKIKLEGKNKKIKNNNPYPTIPKRLWDFLMQEVGIDIEKNCSEISDKDLRKLSLQISEKPLSVKGKTTNKEEFVTSGGIERKEIDFTSMQSKLIPNMFFAGEVIDIDGITGGFNFQNCWSGAWIISDYFMQKL